MYSSQLTRLYPEMLSHIRQYSRQRTELERIMAGNGDVMLALLLSGEAQVATGLPSDLITQDAQPFSKIRTTEITG